MVRKGRERRKKEKERKKDASKRRRRSGAKTFHFRAASKSGLVATSVTCWPLPLYLACAQSTYKEVFALSSTQKDTAAVT